MHGLQDTNVRPEHFSKWWDALPATRRRAQDLADAGPATSTRSTSAGRSGCTRCTAGSTTSSRASTTTSCTEPQADVEYAADQWQTFRRWPVDAREDVSLKLVADTPTTAGALVFGPPPTPNLPRVYQTILDQPSLSETNAISNPTTVTTYRRVFLSTPLEAPVHISGTAVVRARASVNATDTNFGAVLVDYGPATQVSRTGDGAQTLGTSRLLGRGDRGRRRLLLPGREANHGRHPVARLEGHPRRAEPELLRRRGAARPRPGDVVRVPAPAAGLRLPGRSPDRARARRQLLGLRLAGRPEPRNDHPERDRDALRPPDRRRPGRAHAGGPGESHTCGVRSRPRPTSRRARRARATSGRGRGPGLELENSRPRSSVDRRAVS